MQFTPTRLDGVVLVTPRRFGDARGFFAETYSAQRFAEAGIDTVFVQDNHSVSEKAGTVRGLHWQAPPRAQAKLVRCGRGALFDVAVDIRDGSPTFGHWVGYELSEENGHQLMIPAGFAHGFLALRPGDGDRLLVFRFLRAETEARCAGTIPPSASTGRWAI